MSDGFKYEIERPWKHEGAPEFQKVTFDGKQIDMEQLTVLAEKMRLILLEYGIIVRLGSNK